MKNGAVAKRPSDHNHLPNATWKEARHVRRKMKGLNPTGKDFEVPLEFTQHLKYDGGSLDQQIG